MTFLDAVKILMTSVDIHINQVRQDDLKNEDFETYFGKEGWGTAQADACTVVKTHLKRKGLEASWGF